MSNYIFLITAVLLVACNAFQPRMAVKVGISPMITPRTSLAMSRESGDDEPFVPSRQAEKEEAKMSFEMNRIVRLGRSKDQDGKSNIWSIEPRMEVLEEEEDTVKKNLVVGGAVIGFAIAVLPLLSLFSNILPDPADF